MKALGNFRPGMHARTLLAMALLTILCVAGSQAAPPKESKTMTEPKATGQWNVLDFGAKADGQTDDTAAIQKAIDAVTSGGGGSLLMPTGKYMVNGTIDVKPGVAIVGVYDAPASFGRLTGTIILATAGRDQEEGTALFTMESSTMVRGLTIYYPEQKSDDIHPYPWTFHMKDFDNTVEDVTLINSYQGILVGHKPNVRHRIRSVVGCVLRRGIFVDTCADIGRIENVQFHCNWWVEKSLGGDWNNVYKYMGENLEAFIFGYSDWEYVTNNFVFPAKIGMHFIQTPTGATNGQFVGNGMDSTQTAIQVDQIQTWGLLFTNSQLVSFMGDDPVQIRVSPKCGGTVRFVNCSLWGPAVHNAVLDGDGFVSFTDCQFSSMPIKDKDDPNKVKPLQPLIMARSGKLQIHNSTFLSENVGIELGPNLKHAIIQGNNGANGVSIVNNAPKTIIKDNEEPTPPAAK